MYVAEQLLWPWCHGSGVPSRDYTDAPASLKHALTGYQLMHLPTNMPISNNIRQY